ncbi:MAG: hypothetical protein ACUVQ4_09830 [bacterium]
MRLLVLIPFLQLKGMMRQARYGLQFLLLPMMLVSIFLTAYLAVRALGGQVQGLFYPFIVFIFSATAINIPMQAGNQLLSDQSAANLFITPHGLKALIIYFAGIQNIYLLTTLISIIIAYFLARPQIYFLNSILGLLLLVLWCFSLIVIGLGLGMRYLFAFHVAQLIFLGFYLFLILLSITQKIGFAFIFPPAGIIALFLNEGNTLWYFLVTLSGTLVYNLIGMIFIKWAYYEYRIGKGVNRV